MQTLQTNWSTEVSSLLEKHPEWQKMLISAIDKPQLNVGYCPFVIDRTYATGTSDGARSLPSA